MRTEADHRARFLSAALRLCAAIVALLLDACGGGGSPASEPAVELPGVEIGIVTTDLPKPEGLAFDSAGNLHVSLELPGGKGRVLRIAPNGSVSTVAGGMNDPDGLVFDSEGNLFVSEEVRDGRVLRIDPDGNVSVFLNDLVGPEGLGFDPSGALVVAEHFGGRVLRVSPSGEVATLTHLRGPENLALDGSTLYVAETGAGRVVKVGPAGEVETVAVGLDSPDGIAWHHGCERLFVGEDRDGGARILRIETDGRLMTLVSGLRGVQGLAIAPDGSLYAAEQGRRRIIRLSGALC